MQASVRVHASGRGSHSQHVGLRRPAAAFLRLHFWLSWHETLDCYKLSAVDEKPDSDSKNCPKRQSWQREIWDDATTTSTMSATLLSNELTTLISEAKRKNNDLKVAAEKALQDLKALPSTSEAQLVAGKSSAALISTPQADHDQTSVDDPI